MGFKRLVGLRGACSVAAAPAGDGAIRPRNHPNRPARVAALPAASFAFAALDQLVVIAAGGFIALLSLLG